MQLYEVVGALFHGTQLDFQNMLPLKQKYILKHGGFYHTRVEMYILILYKFHKGEVYICMCMQRKNTFIRLY